MMMHIDVDRLNEAKQLLRKAGMGDVISWIDGQVAQEKRNQEIAAQQTFLGRSLVEIKNDLIQISDHHRLGFPLAYGSNLAQSQRFSEATFVAASLCDQIGGWVPDLIIAKRQEQGDRWRPKWRHIDLGEVSRDRSTLLVMCPLCQPLIDLSRPLGFGKPVQIISMGRFQARYPWPDELTEIWIGRCEECREWFFG
jgi:hypothetical protein